MRNSTMIWHTCTYNIRRAFSGVRLYVGLGVCAFACMFYLENALSLCQEYNVKASAVQLFINACTYSFTHSFLFIGWLIAICDTPYLSELQSNILVRIGRLNWLFGQLAFMLLMSCLYWFIAIGIIAFMFMPHLHMSLEWDSISVTLANGNNWSNLNFVIKNYSVLEAFIRSMVLQVFVAYMLGTLVILINQLSHSRLGTALTMVFPFFELAFTGLGISSRFYYISPVTLCNISLMDLYDVNMLPNVSYAYAFTFISAITVSVLYVIINYYTSRPVFDEI